MGKIFYILGVAIDNYTVRESMLLIDEYINSDYLNTINIIFTDTLIKASEDSEFQEYVEETDLNIIGDKTILEAVGYMDSQRIKEVEENAFLAQFMKHILRNRQSVFILCEDRKSTEEISEYLLERYEDLVIVGTHAVEDHLDDDSIVNEVNSVSPDIILSFLESPFQEEFIAKNKTKLSAKLWFGWGSNLNLTIRASIKHNWLVNTISKELFKKRVAKFVDKKPNE